MTNEPDKLPLQRQHSQLLLGQLGQNRGSHVVQLDISHGVLVVVTELAVLGVRDQWDPDAQPITLVRHARDVVSKKVHSVCAERIAGVRLGVGSFEGLGSRLQVALIVVLDRPSFSVTTSRDS
jgi:hypothetical protein